jgi:hypothetical protein
MDLLLPEYSLHIRKSYGREISSYSYQNINTTIIPLFEKPFVGGYLAPVFFSMRHSAISEARHGSIRA